jgi:hypothetical protein
MNRRGQYTRRMVVCVFAFSLTGASAFAATATEYKVTDPVPLLEFDRFRDRRHAFYFATNKVRRTGEDIEIELCLPVVFEVDAARCNKVGQSR